MMDSIQNECISVTLHPRRDSRLACHVTVLTQALLPVLSSAYTTFSGSTESTRQQQVMSIVEQQAHMSPSQ